MKHTRKILSLALALVMALSLCTVTALAVTPDVSTWQNLQTEIDNANTNQTTITLTTSLTGSAPLKIAKNQNITIDLKGFTLDRGLSANSAAQDGYVIENRGTLTITDTSTNKTGKITGGNANWGGAVVCYGTTTLAGGNITGNKSGGNAGAVLVVGGEGGEFVMTGGKISDNTAVNGGAIVLDMAAAKAVISGGEISGNTATYGGAVCNSGTLTISGTAIIKNNTARNGGAINNNSGTVVISGGKITGNKAIRQESSLDGGCGGAIYSYGTVDKRAYVTMTGGEISGNQATKYGGGIGNSGYSTITFGGTAQVKNNTCKIGDADAKTDNVSIRSKSGSNLISVSAEKPLTGNAKIGVNVEKEGETFMADGVAAQFARFFTADDSTKNVEYKDGQFVFVDAPKGLLEGIFDLIRFKKTTDDIKTFSIFALIISFIESIIESIFGGR